MSVTRFRAPRARARAKRDFFSWIDFFCRDGSNEVWHAPGPVREVGFVPNPGRDPDGNGHYENIYIDDINHLCVLF